MTSEDLEKFRIIEAKKTYRPTIRDWLIGNFKAATWDQVRTFVFSFTPPGEELAALLKDIRRWEKDGLMPWQVEETPTGNLQDELLLAAAHYRASLDHLTWVGSLVPPQDETETVLWSHLSRDYFLSPFNEKAVTGGFLTATGRPRMGKTGVGCLYAELWLEEYPGTEVLSNVPLEKPVAGVRPVSRTVALMHGIADALKAERRWLWIFDEPSLSGWMKTDVQTSRAKNLERFARIIPKLGGSLLYIEQREEGVPTILQDFAQSHLICTNPGSVIADLPKRKYSISHVPKPRRVTYRTGEAGFFELEDAFDWAGLFKALRYDPELLLIEDLAAPAQGERIDHFLAKLEERERVDHAKVTCRFCGESWVPKSEEPPGRCPRCDRRDPTGKLATRKEIVQALEAAPVPEASTPSDGTTDGTMPQDAPQGP